MLLWILVAATLVALLGMRIASSPPFALIGCLFASWADRCANGQYDRTTGHRVSPHHATFITSAK